MRIVTNPGANLGPALTAHYGITLSPQQIVVDGVAHDTREEIPLATVDEWVRTSKDHPHVLGTAAAEFAALFRQIAAEDQEIVAVMTSKKIIQSHQAAVSTLHALRSHPRYSSLKVSIVDTTVTDLGAGLIAVLAAEAKQAGLDFDAVTALCEAAAERVRMVLYVATLDNLVKGGRASFLRAWLANVLQVRPLIVFRDGELKPDARVSAKSDPTDGILEVVLREVPPSSRVWVGIAHGDNPVLSRTLAAALRRRFSVEWLRVSLIASSIYLHTGRGAVGVFVLPLDDLPWIPEHAPPDLA